MTEANRNHLIAGVGGYLQCSPLHADGSVKAVLGCLVELIKNNDKVSLHGFGVFERVIKPPHQGRNPRTGAAVQVGETVSIKFRPAKLLKDVST